MTYIDDLTLKLATAKADLERDLERVSAALVALTGGNGFHWEADPDQPPPSTNVVRLPSNGRRKRAPSTAVPVDDVLALVATGVDKAQALIKHFGTNPTTIYRRLNDLKRDGLVTDVGGRWVATGKAQQLNWIENRAREIAAAS